MAADVPELSTGAWCAPFAARLLRDATSRHVIVPFWSAHQLTLALLADERFGMRPAMRTFEVIADDSLGGEIVCALGESLGLTMRRIHTHGDPERLRDVAAWMRTPGPFFIAVDGGARYGTIPTGIIRLAARMKSVLWPLAVRARPAVRIPGLVAEVPLPGASGALGIGAPLEVDRGAPIGVAAEQLRMRLDAATRAADALLVPPSERSSVAVSAGCR